MPRPRKRSRKTRQAPRACWSCQRERSAESFSDAGRPRYLCRECEKLPAAELEFRSVRSNLERMMTPDGMIRRKQRRQFRHFLDDPRERVQALAQQLWKLDAQVRRERREAREPGRQPAPSAEPMEFLAEEAEPDA